MKKLILLIIIILLLVNFFMTAQARLMPRQAAKGIQHAIYCTKRSDNSVRVLRSILIRTGTL